MQHAVPAGPREEVDEHGSEPFQRLARAFLIIVLRRPASYDQ